MFSHSAIWDAIDALAKRHGLSVSGLARLSGLDATAFNPSKRVGKDGRERWPSTESIAKSCSPPKKIMISLCPAAGFCMLKPLIRQHRLQITQCHF